VGDVGVTAGGKTGCGVGVVDGTGVRGPVATGCRGVCSGIFGGDTGAVAGAVTAGGVAGSGGVLERPITR
jgi:hypothetical protein